MYWLLRVIRAMKKVALKIPTTAIHRIDERGSVVPAANPTNKTCVVTEIVIANQVTWS